MLRDWIPVAEIPRSRISRIVSYPVLQEQELLSRVRVMSDIGITHLKLEGNSKVIGVPVLGKGKTSVVVECRWKGKSVALKIMRSDSPLTDFDFEASVMKVANKVGVGPQLYANEGNMLVMELVRGMPLGAWLRSNVTHSAIGTLVRILRQARALDEVGIRHNELSNPSRHIILNSSRPVILDFGSSTFGSRGHNVASVFQYMFLREGKFYASDKRIRERLIRSIRAYRQNPDEIEFESVVQSAISVFESPV